jgi:hypothetical protein
MTIYIYIYIRQKIIKFNLYHKIMIIIFSLEKIDSIPHFILYTIKCFKLHVAHKKVPRVPSASPVLTKGKAARGKISCRPRASRSVGTTRDETSPLKNKIK